MGGGAAADKSGKGGKAETGKGKGKGKRPKNSEGVEMKKRPRHEEEVVVTGKKRSLFSAKEDRSSERALKVRALRDNASEWLRNAATLFSMYLVCVNKSF